MSFKITEDDGDLIPMLICGHCNEPIKELGRGVSLWWRARGEVDPDEMGAFVQILHKGTCLLNVEEWCEKNDQIPLSMELTQFLEAWFQGAQFKSYNRVRARGALPVMRRHYID